MGTPSGSNASKPSGLSTDPSKVRAPSAGKRYVLTDLPPSLRYVSPGVCVLYAHLCFSGPPFVLDGKLTECVIPVLAPSLVVDVAYIFFAVPFTIL